MEDIKEAVHALAAGSAILYPTDTIWGLGCDATNAEAVQQVFNIKKRSLSKSLIILVSDIEMLSRFVNSIDPAVQKMIDSERRPLTIIYPSARNLPDHVLAKDGSIAIRIVKDEFCRRLIEFFGKPIVSTSANIANEKAPSSFADIADEIVKSVGYVVKHRQHEVAKSIPSKIVKITNGTLEIVRA